MQVRALRGVCIGPQRSLALGDLADLDPATARYLISIGAVEKHEAPPPAEEQPTVTKPAKKAGDKE